MIEIEIIYATLQKQTLLSLTVLPNTTVESAIRASKILVLFPEIDLTQQCCGIFGKKVPLTYPLKDQDRLEIYCPLKTDPKIKRKLETNRMRQHS